MKSGLIIYNAHSGSGNFISNLDYLIKNFQKKDICITFYRLEKEVTKLGELLRKEKYEFIILSGGDGTLNIAINHIIKTLDELPPIGIIPSGTSNDFARCLELPLNIKEAIDVIIQGNTRKIDVGLLNKDTYFLSTFAAGMLAGISFETPKDLKEKFGPFAYYMYAIGEVINLKTTHVQIELEDEIIEEEALMVFVVNGKHAGGFENLVSIADITDGLMDVIIVKNLFHINIPPLFLKVLNNDFVNDENVRVLKTDKCRIKFDNKDIATSVDGEKCTSTIRDIEFLKQYLEVYVK